MDRVVHFEIPFDDKDRASKFYSEVFGWGLEPMGEYDYVLVQTGPVDKEKQMNSEPGYINGGMGKRGEPIKAPVVTIEVVSIEEAGKKIEEAGGKMLGEKQPVGEMGFSAYFIDSEGNMIGLWENARKS